jgi:hypothetical protein
MANGTREGNQQVILILEADFNSACDRIIPSLVWALESELLTEDEAVKVLEQEVIASIKVTECLE